MAIANHWNGMPFSQPFAKIALCPMVTYWIPMTWKGNQFGCVQTIFLHVVFVYPLWNRLVAPHGSTESVVRDRCACAPHPIVILGECLISRLSSLVEVVNMSACECWIPNNQMVHHFVGQKTKCQEAETVAAHTNWMVSIELVAVHQQEIHYHKSQLFVFTTSKTLTECKFKPTNDNDYDVGTNWVKLICCWLPLPPLASAMDFDTIKRN